MLLQNIAFKETWHARKLACERNLYITNDGSDVYCYDMGIHRAAGDRPRLQNWPYFWNLSSWGGKRKQQLVKIANVTWIIIGF